MHVEFNHIACNACMQLVIDIDYSTIQLSPEYNIVAWYYGNSLVENYSYLRIESSGFSSGVTCEREFSSF